MLPNINKLSSLKLVFGGRSYIGIDVVKDISTLKSQTNPRSYWSGWINTLWSTAYHLSSCTCVLTQVQLFAILWTVARQVPLSMGFPRQEYWRGLPCSPPGDLPDPGMEPASLRSPALAGGVFTTSAAWEAWPEARTGISALKLSLRGALRWPLEREGQPGPRKAACRTPHRASLRCPPFAVEQVANVVLYSSDYYIKPVAAEETQ